MADSEPRPLLRVQGAKVALAKVSVASRKVRVQPHFESSTSKPKMGRGKRAGHWRAVVNSKLHIDDGTGDWSGGTSITHRNPLNFDSTDGNPNFIDDYYNNPVLFSQNRHHIFHYVVFAHDIFADGDTDRDGRGDRTSDHFAISEPNVPGDEEWKVFMHELGHNLEPTIIPNHLNNQGHHQIKSCIMHSTSYKGTDYCNKCWNSFSLSDGL